MRLVLFFVTLIFPSFIVSFPSSYTTLNCVREHNRYRNVHGSPKLRFDPTLTTYALQRARFLAATDIFAHLKDAPYGENLFMSNDPNTKCKDAVEWWYEKEEGKFDYNKSEFEVDTAHFTQIVWRSSRYVGCAMARSSLTGYVYVAVSIL